VFSAAVHVFSGVVGETGAGPAPMNYEPLNQL
jgi:hypothetical protein